LAFELADNLRAFAPEKEWLRLPRDEFETRYLAKLGELGASAFRAVLAGVFDLHASPSTEGVVLLCFERLARSEEYCHRQLLSAWWTSRSGQEVCELF
jgi:hypothetical protein